MEKLFEGYKFIGTKDGVCGGEPIILGTRLKPEQVVNYGKVLGAMNDFDLTLDQVEECYRFVYAKENK